MILWCVLSTLGGITKTAYVALAKAGAFDVFGVSRKAVVECVPVYLDVLRKERAKLRRVALREAKAAGSVGGVVVEGPVVGAGLPDEGLLVGVDYPVVERLKFEAEVAGQYMSGHPRTIIQRHLNLNAQTAYASYPNKPPPQPSPPHHAPNAQHPTTHESSHHATQEP